LDASKITLHLPELLMRDESALRNST